MTKEEEYNNKLCYQGNIIEGGEIHPLYYNNNGLFGIFGTTGTLDKSDFYVTVFLDGYMINGYLNENPTIARISITKPEYIMYDRLLTKEEKQWFMDYITNDWDKVCDMIKWNYEVYNETVEYHGICPDYSLLPTID